jgi:hypothetical protein
MLVAEKESLLGGKLMALGGRKIFAPRDLLDTQFFLQQGWEVERDMLPAYEVKSLAEYIGKCITLVENVSDNQMLVGLGELIDEKQKAWVKQELKKEALFRLRLLGDMEKEKAAWEQS